MKLEVTVGKLNRRKSPVADFADKSNIVEVVSKGFTFESVAQIENNLGVWHQDRDGFWVWEKGLENLITPFTSLINYEELAFSSIPTNIKNTKGENVKIAIIDTGVNKLHPAFQSEKIKLITNVVDNNDNVNDINGHGSHVAGLIGARGLMSNGVIGVAPLSELLIIKGISDDKSTSSIDLNNALKKAIDLNPEIINLSLDIPEERFGTIEDEITRAIDKGILIVAAAGENERLTDGNIILCPSNEPGIIAVGSCDEPLLKSDIKFNKKLDCIVPNYRYWSCFNETKVYSQESGSSMAAAFVTAIISLIVSSGIRNKEQILKSLKEFSIPISQFSAGQICLLNPSK